MDPNAEADPFAADAEANRAEVALDVGKDRRSPAKADARIFDELLL